MKPIIHFLCFVLMSAIVILSACSKKTDPTLYIPDQFKKYSLFQVGSYWIFKNEKSLSVDSSYVSSTPVMQYRQFDNNGTESTLEFCEIYYKGKFIKHCNISAFNDMMWLLDSYASDCLISGCFYPGFIYNETSYSTFKTIEYIDSLNINNKLFRSIIHTQHTDIFSNNDTVIYNYYLVTGIGLIKFELFNSHANRADTIWTLLKYHIVQ
jgi:hypothetical protein